MRKSIYILFVVLLGTLFSFGIQENDALGSTYCPDSFSQTSDDYSGGEDWQFSDYNDRYGELLAVDISQLGNVTAHLRFMVKQAARHNYQTSVYWAKYAVRRIAEYMQHQSFIYEFLNSNKYRVGMTGDQVQYLYQLCRILI